MEPQTLRRDCLPQSGSRLNLGGEFLRRFGHRRSASAAAEELALTQGAVSRQLQTLEKQLGMELVQREQKRLTLT